MNSRLSATVRAAVRAIEAGAIDEELKVVLLTWAWDEQTIRVEAVLRARDRLIEIVGPCRALDDLTRWGWIERDDPAGPLVDAIARRIGEVAREN